MSNLTREQRIVIESRDKNMLVSASAGSGKTFTMIERILDLLIKKESSINKMLIVTFTNAAASEMKQKIYDKLCESARDNKDLVKEIEELPTADISTLHNFCSKLIKQHFYEVGVDPAFKILDEKEIRVLINESLDFTLGEYSTRNDKEFDKLYETYNKKRRDLEFKRSIVELLYALKNRHNYEEFARRIIENTYSPDFNKNMASLYLNEALIEQFEHFKLTFNNLLTKANMLKSKKLIEVVDSLVNMANMVKGKNNFTKNFKALINLPASVRMPSKVADDEQELKLVIAGSKKEFRKAVDNFKIYFTAGSEDEIKNNLSLAKTHIQKMLEVVLSVDKHYMSLKKDRALLDFNDLEYYALEVLKNENIKQQVKNRYEHIFIDEYQDTNSVQEEIIKKISRDNNAFMVGDAKQSIYMFRGSDPSIFTCKYDNFKTDEVSQKVDLNKNFRSEKSILDFANFVFNNIMKKQTASVDYKISSQLSLGANYRKDTNNLPLVSINIINYEKTEVEKEPLKLYNVKEHAKTQEKDNYTKLEARIVAEKIEEFVGKEFYDAKTGETKLINYSDITILSRTRGQFIKDFCDELAIYNIPIYAKYKLNVYDTYEASLINNYLKLINNTYDDLALASVLTSTIVGLNYDELAKIKTNGDTNNFYEAMSEYREQNKQSEISERISKLFNELNEFRKSLKFLTVTQLIEAVVLKYNLYDYFLALPGGKNRLENIKMLISASKKIEIKDNLFKYINYLETAGEEELFEINIGSSWGSVNITTIHSSKGLEYPVVILVGAGKDFTKKPVGSEILLNKDLGFGVRYYDFENRKKVDTITRSAIKLKNKEEELAEEMRLLYVAITRAKNHLVLVGKVTIEKLTKIETAYKVKNGKSYLSWVLGSLENSHLNALKAGKQKLQLKLADDTTCEFKVYLKDELEKTLLSKKPVVFSETDETYKKAFLKTFAFKYGFESSKNILAKSSVTEIVEAEEDVNYSIKRLRIDEVFDKTKETDFSQIGNIYHLAMQHLSFKDATEENIKEQIKQLISKSILPIEATEILEIDKLVEAINQINLLIDDGDEVLREQQFLMYIPYDEIFKDSGVKDKILIQGVVDLIIIKNGEAYVIDYKTSRIKNTDKLREKYSVQLELYKKAVEKAFGVKVSKKLIYSLYLNSIVIV
jgi:ATP-dependent helicase/nuclease subunit A